MRDPLVERSARAAVAGVVAVVPMSLWMLVAKRLGMLRRQPPEEITERSSRRVGIELDEGASDAVSIAAHVAYGAGVGAAYGSIVPARLAGGVSGVAYGLAVYGASYLGWLPAMHLRPAGQGRANRPTVAMVLAHVVYGWVVGRLTSSASGERPHGRRRTFRRVGND
ncbi:MAG TPA: hypothetical protein VK867_01910 [Candidatus Limnocylindrales bacterium]|nr:hypothetical protein [Candidatus Limnocylindrales bacterium]